MAAAFEKTLRQVLANDEEVLAAYLFGSFARGTARTSSDVDVGILYARRPGARLLERFRLEGTLEQAIGRQVQVIVLNDAPPDLVHRVLRDGRLLVNREPGSRIQFEVAARNAFFDLLPIRRRYREGTP